MSKPKFENLSKKHKQRFAKKSLGQNFLVDKNYIDKIIGSLNPRENETIVEIGAGRGALTERLVENAAKVLAIEIDRNLTPELREKFGHEENFVLIERDALEIDFGSLISLQSTSSQTKLVANLPYYISTAILQHLILYRASFSEIILMLQKEVVERITAEAGKKERGFLTVLIEAYFETDWLFDVPKTAFRPVPKVTSAVIRLKPKGMNSEMTFDSEIFRKVVSLCFQHKRKTIQNNLKNASGVIAERIENKGGLSKILEETKIESIRRAESLTIEEWISLTNVIQGASI